MADLTVRRHPPAEGIHAACVCGHDWASHHTLVDGQWYPTLFAGHPWWDGDQWSFCPCRTFEVHEAAHGK